MTLLCFLGGDNTVGPSRGLSSKTFGLMGSFFGGGLGSKAGSVGGGMEEKYLEEKQKINFNVFQLTLIELYKSTYAPEPVVLRFLL